MLSQRFVSLLPTSTSFVLLQKRKRELAPGYIWMDEETGVFLSLMQGDKTTIGYFNWMKLKNKRIKKKKKMPRTKAIVGIEEIAGLMKGLRSARQQSPFFTMVIRDEWLVSFDYAIVIHSIHSMLKNSIHSIQKLMNGPTVAKFVGRSRPIWTSVVDRARVACALWPVQSIPVAIFLNHDAQSAAQTTRFRLRSELRPAGGDPVLDHLQKYFFDSLCFLEWTWPFWNPWKPFHEKNVWFKQRKTRRKVVPSLTPFGAARAAVQLTG